MRHSDGSFLPPRCGAGDPSLEVCPDGVRFLRYPFYPASPRRGSAFIPRAHLAGWNPTSFPPCLYRVEGGQGREVLFVGAAQRDLVAGWAGQTGLLELCPVDVWALLLEPYLDTEFESHHQARTLQKLAGCGLLARHVEEVRRRLGPRMLAFNSLAWEWVHLGHYDLLSVFRPLLRSRSYEKLYQESMELAWAGFPSLPGER